MKLFKPFKYLKIRSMYTDIFGGYTPDRIVEKAKPLVKDKIEEIKKEIKLAKEKLKDIPGTNYKLGLYHLKMGNIEDAIMRFKMVVYLAPEMPDSYYNLGRALLIKGDYLAAEQNFQKALSLKPNSPEADYEISKIKAPHLIDSIPQSIISEHLEWQKELTDENLELREQLDKLLVNTVLANISDKNPNLDVLDLGSNMGGRGRAIRNKEVARRVIGVDIDKKANEKSMKDLFNGEPIYNNVVSSEISTYLADNKDKFDVIFAGGIFSYQGSLAGIFSNIAKSLKSEGVFAALLAESDVYENFKIDVAKDRFIHSLQYVENELKKAGFTLEEKKERNIQDKTFNIIVARPTSG